jgi:hypothetical protein
MITRGMNSIVMAGLTVVVMCWATVSGKADWDEDQVIPLLKTRAGTYTNVTISSRTAKEVCILHEGGVGNVLFEDLDAEGQALLGYAPPVAKGEALRVLAQEKVSAVLNSLPFDSEAVDAMGSGSGQEVAIELSPAVMGLLIAVSIAGYLFYCYCLMLICAKAGHEPGPLVWLPLLQVFPMLRAAGMSGWWVLGMLVPLLNLVVTILWCFKIVSARGKSPVWAVLLILPFTNLIAFLYLAFSGDGNHEDETPSRVPALAVRAV